VGDQIAEHWAVIDQLSMMRCSVWLDTIGGY
jgi:hypothetical protein